MFVEAEGQAHRKFCTIWDCYLLDSISGFAKAANIFLIGRSITSERHWQSQWHTSDLSSLWLLPTERPIGRVGFAPTEIASRSDVCVNSGLEVEIGLIRSNSLNCQVDGLESL